MELMGALSLAPLISTVLTAFEGTLTNDSAFCWLDSQFALWWIWGVKRNSSNLCKIAWWTFVILWSQHSGITAPQNPIQLASVLVVQWLLNLWPIRCGGMVLIFFWGTKCSGQSLRGNSIEVTNDDSDPSLELKKGKSSSYRKQQESAVLANFVTETVTTRKLNLECIISLENFSSLQTLIRFTAYVLQFVSNLKRKKAHK